MTILRLSPTLLLMLCAICAYADESTETSSETEIIALDEAWIDAEVSGDRIALERILHEDFLATCASGRTIDRTTFIDRVLANKPAPFSVTHESIRVHGDTALVIDLSADGKTKFTWIAVKRDGQWRVISETFSTVEST
jgi:ketosteroid isomerase-like protein